MSEWYLNDDNHRDIVTWIRQYHPDVSEVHFTRPTDGAGDSVVPPDTHIRVRSRGRHVPGSGDYFCSNIYSAHGYSGWLEGNACYLTAFNATVIDTSGQKQAYTFDVSSETVEMYLFVGVATWYRFDQYYYDSNGYWNVSTWHGDMSGYHSYDECKAYAFSQPPERGTHAMRWNGEWLNYGHHPFNTPTFEDHYLSDIISTGSMPNLSSYLNAAAVEAFKSLPAIQTNNIANLLQIYSGLKSIVELRNVAHSGQRVISGVGSLADAWLGYRYSYSTTKSDIEELVGYADRMRALRHTPSVTGHGLYKVAVGGDEYIFRCSVQAPVTDLGDIYNTAEQFGLALDGYNAWDLIPYSFIVDWFLHIGDILEGARSRRYAVKLHPSAVWYSVTHEFTNSSGSHQCDYYRWRAPNVFIDASHAASLLSHGSSSQSTWVKRGADAVALLS